MIRKYGTIILIAAFFILNAALAVTAKEKKETAQERKRLKDNKVISMTRFTYFPGTETKKKSAYYLIDQKFNKSEIKDFDIEGNVFKITTFKYNDKGHETEYIETDALGNQISRHENVYDKKDNIIEERFYGKNNELNFTRICKYDPADNMTEYSLYDRNKKLQGTWKFKYDNRGNRSEAEILNAAGQYTGKYSYIYSDREELLETYTYDKSGKITGRNSNKYDKNGLLTDNVVYNASGQPTSWKKFDYEYARKTDEKPPVAAVPAAKRTSEVSIASKTPDKPVAVTRSTDADVPSADENGSKPTGLADDENSRKLKKYRPKNEEEKFNPPVNTEVDKDQAVMLAIRSKPETLLGILKSNELDVNVQNGIGWTPLMMAVYSGNLETVKALVREGANTEITDHSGNNVFKYAEYSLNKQVTEYMKSLKK